MIGTFVLERLTQPELEPITLAEAKRHIRQFATVTSEDGDIEQWVKVAREWVEHYTGRVLVDQTWRLTVNQGPLVTGDDVSGYSRPGYYSGRWVLHQDGIWLRRSPVIAITSVVTVDALGAETEVDAATYQLRDGGSKWPRIVALSGAPWKASTFRITFRAGFADRLGSPQTGVEMIPSTLKHAVKLLVGHFDTHREPVNIGNIVTELPLGLRALMDLEKCDVGFG